MTASGRSFSIAAKAAVCIIKAYETTLDSLRGSIFASGHREAETREIIVRTIIDMAEHGERDPARLRDRALQWVWKS